MSTVHFTLGENIGIQLAEIAREHVQDLNLDKAIDVFTESFGCSEKLAKKLVIGEYAIIVDDSDKCTVNCVDRDSLTEEQKKEYPTITFEWIHKIVDRWFQDGFDAENEHVFEHTRLEMSTVNRLIAVNEPLDIDANLTSALSKVFPDWFKKGIEISGTISIKPRVIVRELLDNHANGEHSEFEDFIHDIDEMNLSKYGDEKKLARILAITNMMLAIIDHKDQFMALEEFAVEMFGCDNFHKNITEIHIEAVEELVKNWEEWC